MTQPALANVAADKMSLEELDVVLKQLDRAKLSKKKGSVMVSKRFSYSPEGRATTFLKRRKVLSEDWPGNCP